MINQRGLMKQIFALLAIFSSAPVFATPELEPFRKPFRYETQCVLESGIQSYYDICVVIETREKGGALRTRNIFSNKHGLTIKGRFDKDKGYMTWDSHNKYEYKWEYKIGGNDVLGSWTYVMPGFLLQNVSWD